MMKLQAKLNDFDRFLKDRDIDPAVVKQGGIGVVAGLVLIIAITLSSGHTDTPESKKTTSSTFSIASLFQADTPRQDAKQPSLYTLFEKNKRPLNAKQETAIADNTPRLSLVVYNMGKSKNMVDALTHKMPPDITIGLSPYTNTYNVMARDLTQKGFETWLNLQSITRETDADNGAQSLNPTRNFSYNISFLEQQTQNKSHVTGVILDQSSLISESTDLWMELSRDLLADGYGIFDLTPAQLPPSFFYYNNLPAPYIKESLQIETNLPDSLIKHHLAEMKERIKTGRNLVLAVNIYTPTALDILADWVNSLEQEGITLIPLSAQAKL